MGEKSLKISVASQDYRKENVDLLPRKTAIAFFALALSAPFVASSGANEKTDCLESLANESSVGQIDYTPIPIYPPIKLSDLARVEDEMVTQAVGSGMKLKKSGVQTSAFFDVLFQRTTILNDIPPQGNGGIYEVLELPLGKGPRSHKTPAFQHPDMEAYWKRLKTMGIKLEIDTSLPLTGTGAYCDLERVALTFDSNWDTFIHEFQHAEFRYFIGEKFESIVSATMEGKSLDSLLSANYPAGKVDRLIKLIQRGLPKLAVNESMSVNDELRTMGLRRYFSSGATASKRYMLRHQITELMEVESTGTLTEVQRRTLQDAKERYARLLKIQRFFDRVDSFRNTIKDDKQVRAVYVGGAAVIGSLLAYKIAKRIRDHIEHPRKDLNSYRQIIYDEKGNAFGELEEGKWIQLFTSPRLQNSN